jgi:hypothetical protein
VSKNSRPEKNRHGKVKNEDFNLRLWTLHPKYLDRQGLLALWREGLLAQAVLKGNTKGYKNHPQLERFKCHPDPLGAIAHYLHVIHEEAKKREYVFDASKIGTDITPQSIQTTSGQLEFESKHLLNKLKTRSQPDYQRFVTVKNPEPHPLFQIIPGEIEEWEKR